ncbi:L-threonylcarbamoyladenylate synthase [Psychrobacter sp. I-STPA6b]|uniref:L-threonylcarbamoyladenylate synthase n=1 Tax=Psychrobacter sp. I-STPA6b TaxID=2585718 RepID=UPI001D0C690A|nr:Sua5/YciO/YrdC/YwlC family protein [Psychrobacter sp. I-STPA6b]
MTTSAKTSKNTTVFTDIQQAVAWIKQGQILVYPTESVWGIGCDPFNQKAVQTVLQLKSRPQEKGMIVVTDKLSRIASLIAPLSDEQRQRLTQSISQLSLINLNLPTAQQQAQTWLLPLMDNQNYQPDIPQWITGNHDSVAVRVIAHPMIKQICQQMVSEENPYGFIVSTSCNQAGQPPANSLEQAQASFANHKLAKHIGYLQGDTLGYQLPSQIRDIRTGQVLR